MGFPTLKRLIDAFESNNAVTFLAVQTVFEGHRFNTPDKLRRNQLKYDVNIPMAHAPGDKGTPEIPPIMRNYRSGGTPWTVIINQEGIVVYNHFHIKANQAATLIKQLLAIDR